MIKADCFGRDFSIGKIVIIFGYRTDDRIPEGERRLGKSQNDKAGEKQRGLPPCFSITRNGFLTLS